MINFHRATRTRGRSRYHRESSVVWFTNVTRLETEKYKKATSDTFNHSGAGCFVGLEGVAALCIWLTWSIRRVCHGISVPARPLGNGLTLGFFFVCPHGLQPSEPAPQRSCSVVESSPRGCTCQILQAPANTRHGVCFHPSTDKQAMASHPRGSSPGIGESTPASCG